jgi:hypothetical protein
MSSQRQESLEQSSKYDLTGTPHHHTANDFPSFFFAFIGSFNQLLAVRMGKASRVLPHSGLISDVC